MASSATIPMAQSVSIPNHDRPDLADLERAAAHDDQGQRLPLADVSVRHAAGQGARAGCDRARSARARRSTSARATTRSARRSSSSSSREYEKLGGKIGVNVSWNPDQPNFDTEAQQLVDGSPAGWVIIDFPETFQKFAPSLVRTGKWDASKTFMTEALRNTDVLDEIGSPVVGLRGTAASAAGGPAGASFAAYWKKNVKGAKPYTGFEGTALDAGERRVPRRAAGVLVLAREDQGEPRQRLGPARA